MKLQEVLATRNHGSSGELLNLNDSGTSFTAAGVQITSEITRKTTRHAKRLRSKRFVGLLCCVRPSGSCRVLSCLYSAEVYDSSDCAAQNSQKKRNNENKLSRLG